MEEMVTISRADDGGFIVGIRVKKKKKKEDKDEICCGTHNHKTLLAKDLDEVNETLKKILPGMKAGGMEEDELTRLSKKPLKRRIK